MLEFEGKYNSARVMIDHVDAATQKQIFKILNHPAFANTNIVIMPDTHVGSGAVVGFTATGNEYVVPSVVGVDIGCGIDAYNLGQVEIDYKSFDNYIRAEIPSGFNRRESELPFLKKQYEEFIDQLSKLCTEISGDLRHAITSLGTLGGGNHFIELDKDPSGNIWLSIHSGSRKLGQDVAVFHRNRARAKMKEMFGGGAYYKLEFLPLDEGGDFYKDHMAIAQKYAAINRDLMAQLIVESIFKLPFRKLGKIGATHNFISFEDNIIRKGAISAYKGEKVIIPLNMRDGIIVGVGKGAKSWNYSAPHGAGRLLSRSEAKEKLSMNEFKETMGQVYSTCVNEQTLNESPMAYKDMSMIVNAISETVEISFIMKPIYNFKGF